MQIALSEPDFISQLTDRLAESGSDITITSNVANVDVEVVISNTIDTTEASSTINPVTAVENIIQEHGFTDSTVEGDIFNALDKI